MLCFTTRNRCADDSQEKHVAIHLREERDFMSACRTQSTPMRLTSLRAKEGCVKLDSFGRCGHVSCYPRCCTLSLSLLCRRRSWTSWLRPAASAWDSMQVTTLLRDAHTPREHVSSAESTLILSTVLGVHMVCTSR